MLTTLKNRYSKGFACVLVSLLSACGGDDAEDGAPSCGVRDAPTLIPLRDVSPARGASVPNTDITHRFTVVGIDTILQAQMMLPSSHTAGESTPHQIQITPHIMGADVMYEFSPMKWSVAPGRVVIQDGPIAHETGAGCFYKFPTPIFEYQIVP